MNDGPVTLRMEGRVAVITLDDGKVNALGPPLMTALAEALDQAEAEASAIVLAGRANRFCAGFDLNVLMSGPQQGADLFEQGARTFQRIYGFPRPVVAACTGHALAGGALLLLCCDVRVGAQGPYRIGLNEVAIGMTLPHLGVELARDRLDPRRLTEATILGRIYGPDEAVAVGFLDHLAAPEAVLDEAIARAAQLATLPTPALAGTKQMVRGGTLIRLMERLEEAFEGLRTTR